MSKPGRIVITGASSGIGAALALHYAAPGVVLGLTGRDAGRLAAVADACRAKGAGVVADTVDVVDRAALAAWLSAFDDAHPVDLLVANAGISAGSGAAGETEEQSRRIFAVNLDGVLNTVYPLLPRLRARRRGQVALVSSLAGFRGFPGAPAYCASKAAVRVWGESLRPLLAADGVGLSVVCPGFVVSRITDRNDFPMPFLMGAERAACIIADGLAANRARIAFPWPMRVMTWLVAALPPAWTDPLLSRTPRKAAQT